MENTLQIFNNPEFGEIRVVIIDGEPWFVGKDVATALGYTNPRKALKDHVPDKYKLTEQIVTSGQRRSVTLINEAGLYKLVMRSKLESAEKFSDWVCEEVLPSIRKTGTYTVENPRIPTDQLINSLVPIEWHGERVLTTTQLSAVYEVSKSAIRMGLHRNRNKFTAGVHFFKLQGDELHELGSVEEIIGQDPPRPIPALYLWTKQGAELHAKLNITKRARKAFKLLETRYFGKSVDETQRKNFASNDKINSLLQCAKLTVNPELRDSIIRQTVQLILR